MPSFKLGMELRALVPGEQLEDVIANAPLALVQFGTASCAPCRAIRQKVNRWLDERSKEPGRLPVDAVYVSLDEHPALAAQADVLSAPTLRFYAQGRLWAEAAGYFSLEEFLDRAERVERLMQESDEIRS
ncbi:MAG: thioredoxin family protein [Atopobiaceae bacterium]|nr:thioredoxin family protein [Atopobiaceae bacterium]